MDELLNRLAANAARQPDHPAIVDDGRAITYAAFLDRARRTAAAIASHGDGPKVMIHLPQGMDAYVGMFATALAGGFYSPSGVDAPLAKRRLVLERFAPDVIFSTRDLFEELTAGLPPPLPALVEPEAAAASQGLAVARPPHDIAYVIFTSGSTGVPKGVVIGRAALTHYIDWAVTAMGVTRSDRWSQHPNIGFDLSVLDIYGALCGGATLFPITRPLHRLMPAMAIRDLGLTVWNSVPSVISLMARSGQITAANLASLRLMTFCGEPLLRVHLDAVFGARPELIVHNTYGPTEATVSCSLIRLASDGYLRACRHNVAIGEAIAGMGLHLVGGERGDEGELVITGPQLAHGYWRDDEATAARFREVDVGGKAVRAYFTGDWARRLDGDLHFVRRLDSQAKILGHRIELGEVDAALRRCGFATVTTAVIHGELHAFVEAARAVDAQALRAQLATQLEPHAIPAHFHMREHLPRNTNDKIDVRALVADIGGTP